MALLGASFVAQGFNETRQLDPEDRGGNWSLGVAYAWQDSLYAGEGFRRDFMPTFVYTGERFFLDTTDFGWRPIDSSKWQLDVFASYFVQGYNDHTFFNGTGDVRPENDPLKGMERRNAFEGAFELTRKTSLGRFGFEARHDVNSVHNGADLRAKWARIYRRGAWQIEPWLDLRWLSNEKADYYFGVRESEATDTRPAYSVDDSLGWGAGIALRYRFWSDHNLSLNLAWREQGSEISASPVVDESAAPRIEFSYRYEPKDLRVPRGSSEGEYNFFNNNGNAASLRAAYGCTTDTKFNAIIRGDIDCGEIGTDIASLFIGRKISNRIMTLPLEGWLQGGLVRRFESGLQDDFFEVVLGFKAIYRRFPWSKHVETRIGLGHGLSYAAEIPALEQQKAVQKNRQTSRLLNYMDFSIDVSVGDVFRSRRLQNVFFGFSVHHRSGVFASADIFNNTYGGSNVNTLYLEWEFD
ncbi:MAG: MipA/OmpV family protein [Halieaceae bacterium]|nr:MipA/OmpV family protein [Halieaceae bacterium]